MDAHGAELMFIPEFRITLLEYPFSPSDLTMERILLFLSMTVPSFYSFNFDKNRFGETDQVFCTKRNCCILIMHVLEVSFVLQVEGCALQSGLFSVYLI